MPAVVTMPVNIRMPLTLREAVQREATRESLTVSAVIRRVLIAHFRASTHPIKQEVA